MASTIATGTIARVFYEGKGAELVESFTVKGKPMTKRWTAWFAEPHGMAEGDEATISGLHGDEISEWEKDGEKRHSVKRTLNSAKILPSRDRDDLAEILPAGDDSSVPF